jgi:hypothetical protein
MAGVLLCVSQGLQAQVVTNNDMGCSVTINTPPDVAVPLPNRCAGDCTSDGFGGATYGVTINQPETTASSPCGVTQVTVDYNDPTLHPPPDFACLTPSCRTIESTITVDTLDGGKVVIVAQNQLCVESHYQVVFAPGYPIRDDNADDNDSVTCEDALTTTQIANRFTAGQTVEHHIQILDCSGIDVTSQIAPTVRVMVDVDEYQGAYFGGVVIDDVPESAGAPDGGVEMTLRGNHFQYNVRTQGYETGTIAPGNNKFFRSCVSVVSRGTGVVLGREDAILESK